MDNSPDALAAEQPADPAEETDMAEVVPGGEDKQRQQQRHGKAPLRKQLVTDAAVDFHGDALY